MEISGPAKPTGSFLMEMMAIPRVVHRDTVEFCLAATCHSWCFPFVTSLLKVFPVPSHEPSLCSRSSPARLRGRCLLPLRCWDRFLPLSQAFCCAGISEQTGGGG